LIERANASRKNVRNFGFLFSGLCLLAAGYLLYRENGAWQWAGIAAVLFALGGAFAYPALKPVYLGWMAFAFLLAWINTRVLLGIFFYLVMTPIGLVLRLTGKDLLDTTIDKAATSYWIKRTREPLDPKRYERLF
jgi:hypothetical protein